MSENHLKKGHLEVKIDISKSMMKKTGFEIWSHDVNSASIILIFTRSSEHLPIPCGTKVRVVMQYVVDGEKKTRIETPTIIDNVRGVVRLDIPNETLGYVGEVVCGTYIDFGNEQSIDAGYFTFTMNKSMIDDELGDMDELYISEFKEALEKFEEVYATYSEKYEQSIEKDHQTFEQWFSELQEEDLTGPPGEPGPPGEQGSPGVTEVATQLENGLMSMFDKEKLDNISFEELADDIVQLVENGNGKFLQTKVEAVKGLEEKIKHDVNNPIMIFNGVGGTFLTDAHTYNFKMEKVTQGIYFIWTSYADGVGPNNASIHSCFIPKSAIGNYGTGHAMFLKNPNIASGVSKYVYINPSGIISGTENNGVGDARTFVCRAIFLI